MSEFDAANKLYYLQLMLICTDISCPVQSEVLTAVLIDAQYLWRLVHGKALLLPPGCQYEMALRCQALALPAIHNSIIEGN